MSDKNLNPIIQFKEWFNLAISKEINDPNAMCLSTIGSDNKPHSRMVLLKDYNDEGFVFYTNYESNKGNDISINSNVCLNFHWKSLLRQVRIEGTIEKLPEEISDKYYNSRHYLSRIGAWASDQSRTLNNRKELEEKIEFYKEKFPDEKKVPRPPHWGGLLIRHRKIEFWQDMPHRIHKREVYEYQRGVWGRFTLNP